MLYKQQGVPDQFIRRSTHPQEYFIPAHLILKIDQADDSPIIKAIVAIASGLGMNVVAEGVETPIQAEFLKNLGCSQMQGYLYGHPQPLAALEHRLLH